MSYEKNTWNKGDVITATKLNHMEDGIAGGGGVLVVNSVYDEQADTTTLDKTWQEIYDAPVAVMVGNTPFGKAFAYVSVIGQMQGEYSILFAVYSTEGVDTSMYACNSANDYPVLQDN